MGFGLYLEGSGGCLDLVMWFRIGLFVEVAFRFRGRIQGSGCGLGFRA